MSVESWGEPEDPRVRRSRHEIFRGAIKLAEAGVLGGATMKALSDASGLSVNTIKRQYRNINSVSYALNRELSSLDLDIYISEKARREISEIADMYHDDGEEEEYLRKIDDDIEYLSKPDDKATISPVKAIKKLKDIMHDLRDNFPDEARRLATTCEALAEKYLHSKIEMEKRDSAEEAVRWAREGLEYVESDRHARYFELGRNLAFQWSTAMHRILAIDLSAITAESTEAERLAVRVRVVSLLGGLQMAKRQERDYARKQGHPLREAAAEFHRARAEALAMQNERGEVEAVLQMASSLRNISKDFVIPEDILEIFLVRMCATQVAYRAIISEEEHRQLDGYRPWMIEQMRLKGKGDPLSAGFTKARVMGTMFTLADSYPRATKGSIPARKVGRDSSDDHIHMADLMFISSYGAIGRLLIADYLQHRVIAREGSGARKPEGLPFFVNDKDLRNSPRYWYEKVFEKTLLVGQANVLSEEARSALSDEKIAEVDDVKPWVILDNNGSLNYRLLDQLCLGAVTGQYPSVSQAKLLLQELQPLLSVLHDISGLTSGPVENSGRRT